MILFLDIDGVLNGHEYDPQAESCLIKKECIDNLSKILTETSAKVVISSARYMVTRGAMTLQGFEYLLRTHGLHNITSRIIGTTREDLNQTDPLERPKQIQEWLESHPEVITYVILDDLDLGPIKNHIRTDGKIGLTLENVNCAIEILGKG